MGEQKGVGSEELTVKCSNKLAASYTQGLVNTLFLYIPTDIGKNSNHTVFREHHIHSKFWLAEPKSAQEIFNI